MSDVHVTGAISTDEALTIEKCIGKCLALNTTYAALQVGSNVTKCAKLLQFVISKHDFIQALSY